MSAKIVDEAGYKAAIKTGVTLVDFYADWCGPCKAMSPILDQIAKEYEGRTQVVKVNVDKTPGPAAAQGVVSIPTMAIFLDGDPVTTLVGAQPKAKVTAALDQLL